MMRLRLNPKLPSVRVVLAAYSVLAIALAKAAVEWRADLFLFFPKPGAPSTPIQKAAGGTETILVVEDEPALRGLVGKILGRYGYRIVTAANGPEALQRWHEQADEIDLLLTDLVMPEQPSGMELAKQLKAECPRLKVIYSSGYSLDLQAQNPVLREGVNFLSKPYNPSTLAATVRKRLDAEDD